MHHRPLKQKSNKNVLTWLVPLIILSCDRSTKTCEVLKRSVNFFLTSYLPKTMAKTFTASDVSNIFNDFDKQSNLDNSISDYEYLLDLDDLANTMNSIVENLHEENHSSIQDEINDAIIEEIEEKLQDNGFFDVEIIYYYKAMQYLLENDQSLCESLEIAHELGHETDSLDSEKLATLLASRKESEQWYGIEKEMLSDLFFAAITS